MSGVLLMALACSAGLAATSPCVGQCFEEAKLLASDGAEGDYFGRSVSIFGDVAVVGAAYDDDNGLDSGSAYVCRYDGTSWIEEAKLLPTDGAGGAYFGLSVSVFGNVVVVGAYRDDEGGSGAGAGYVFRYNGSAWFEEAKLLAADGIVGDFFGYSVSLHDDVLVIGAYEDYDNGADSGSAYVFRYDGAAWIQEAKLLPSDGDDDDKFGKHVSVFDGVALIGAPADDDNGPSSGSAYVYRYDGSSWIEEAKLLASDGWGGDAFGDAVSLCGDIAVVGAHGHDANGSNGGAAYVYRFDGASWLEDSRFLASDGEESDYFGYAVSVSDSVVLVGAYSDSDNGPESGSAYVYRHDGTYWMEEVKLLASDGAEDDRFGFSVSVFGDVALVGSADDDQGEHSGAAYVFDMPAVYVGEPGGSWFDPANWGIGYVPDAETDAFIPGQAVIDQPGAVAELVTVQPGGSLTFGSGSDLTIAQGLTIQSGGALNGDGHVYGDVHNYGLVSPGASAGCLEIAGNYTQHASGELFAELAEELQHDLLDVAGPETTLDGALTVDLIEPYQGWPEDAFDVVQCPSIVGDFAVVDLPIVDDCLSVDVHLLEDAVQIEFEPAPIEPEQAAKLMASDYFQDDYFGHSVSIRDEIAVIGAWRDDDSGSASGSVYVYRYDGLSWIEEAKLLASDGAEDDYFGRSVSISGNVVVVGANGEDSQGSDSGAAYVFRDAGSSWIEEAKLLASDGAAGDEFGSTVSISGGRIVVGAHGDDDHGSDAGAAYVYRYDGSAWVEEAKLLASDGAAGDWFGSSVSIFGDVIVIGAPEPFLDAPGSAYVFVHDGTSWVEDAKLLASDGSWFDLFGVSVATSGDVIVVGAEEHEDRGPRTGAAYLFRIQESSWIEIQELLPSDVGADDRFGCSVSISGDLAVIGASEHDENGNKSGSAYVFRDHGTAWVQESKLLASDGLADDHFGAAVSISHDLAVIGAYRDDEYYYNTGSAYVFDFRDCNNNGIADECDIRFGYSNDINGNGIPDECECPADFDHDGVVGVPDLLHLLGAWGTPDGDVDGDGDTDTSDLLTLLAAWGECP